MNIICFIPARKGSQRIKNKNILKIKGRPLIYWTVKQAIKLKLFDKIYFSSDSIKYYKNLKYYLHKDKISTAKLIFDYRDKKHSSNKSRIFEYIKNDFIKKFSIPKKSFLVQLLPTCPLRSNNTIKNCIKTGIKTKKNIFSVCEYDFHLSFALKIGRNNWYAKDKNSPLITGKTRGQDQKKFYHPNGSVNCIWVNNNLKNRKSIYKGAIPFICKKIESLDIDNHFDLNYAEKALKF